MSVVCAFEEGAALELPPGTGDTPGGGGDRLVAAEQAGVFEETQPALMSPAARPPCQPFPL